LSLQIFIPNKTGCDLAYLRDVGLEELLRDGDRTPLTVNVLANGPSGGGGIVFFWPPDVAGPRNGQTWHAAKPDPAPARKLPAKRFWFSVDGATPETLARDAAVQLPGYPVQLGDGREWIVPNAMLLPARWALTDSGQTERLPIRRVEKVHQRMTVALSWIERQFTGQTDGTDWDTVIAYVADLLSINYRVDREICLALELFDDLTLRNALRMSVDLEKLQAILRDLKKNNAGQLTASPAANAGQLTVTLAAAAASASSG
jgi:hypothetical protein